MGGTQFFVSLGESTLPKEKRLHARGAWTTAGMTAAAPGSSRVQLGNLTNAGGLHLLYTEIYAANEDAKDGKTRNFEFTH
jgi:hypothetical protein